MNSLKMALHRSTRDWLDVREQIRKDGLSLGFVPTMGALHEGHGSLVRRAKAENDVVICTVFVNPMQFDRAEDLAKYPRTPQADAELLQSWGCDHLLVPSEAELYPDGGKMRVTESEDSRILCGAHRPGHFEGVLTVVMKLLHLAGAGRAYFGEKDFQQLRLIQEMARVFFLETEIIGCPTVRESSGLAMSSRNLRLSLQDREKAAQIPRILGSAPTAEAAEAALRQQGFRVDYVSDRWGRRLAAVHLGDVRLIDNVSI